MTDSTAAYPERTATNPTGTGNATPDPLPQSVRTGRRTFAMLPALGVAFLIPWGTSLAQETWRGLNVPKYPNATDYKVSTDNDEYDIHFHSKDDVKKVFDFYRDYLTQQGFKVTKSEDKKHGFKANMARGQGGPDDTIELDAKIKHGRYKVEIEFDE